MYLTWTLRRTLLVGGFSILAGLAIAGWSRHSEPARPIAPGTYTSAPDGTPSRGPEHFVYYAPSEMTAAAVQPVVLHRGHTRRYRRRVVVRRRPLSHSLAIVGGSAAGGALIGGLAGGGKGAAIGALVGGGGGLVYDRMTHKKRVVVRQRR